MKRRSRKRVLYKYGWTKNILINNIENKSYEKYLLNQTNFEETLPKKYITQAKLAIKDEYIFDFMELSEQHSEKELEQSLVNNMRAFLEEIERKLCFSRQSIPYKCWR